MRRALTILHRSIKQGMHPKYHVVWYSNLDTSMLYCLRDALNRQYIATALHNWVRYASNRILPTFSHIAATNLHEFDASIPSKQRPSPTILKDPTIQCGQTSEHRNPNYLLTEHANGPKQNVHNCTLDSTRQEYTGDRVVGHVGPGNEICYVTFFYRCDAKNSFEKAQENIPAHFELHHWQCCITISGQKILLSNRCRPHATQPSDNLYLAAARWPLETAARCLHWPQPQRGRKPAHGPPGNLKCSG